MYRFKSLGLNRHSVLVSFAAQRLTTCLLISGVVVWSAVTHAQTEPNSTATAQIQQSNTTTVSTAPTAMASSTPDQSNSGKTKQTPNKHQYGDNPNIFSVLGHKTQEKVVQSAEKVGEVTQKGISKIKPSVDQAWDVVTAKPVYKVPIEHKALSESSNTTHTTTDNTANQSPAAPTQSQPLTKLSPATAAATSETSNLPNTAENPVQNLTPALKQAQTEPKTPATSITSPKAPTTPTTDLRHL